MGKKHRSNFGKNVLKASGSNQNQFDQLLSHVGRQIDAGQLGPAETALQQILQQQPHNGRALYLMGVLAHRMGHIETAAELVEQAIKSLPKVALYHLSLTEMYRQLGRLDIALIHGKKAVKLDRSNAVAHSSLGFVYFDSKKYDQAATCQQHAVKLNPNLVQALNNLGCIYGERGENEKAVKYFRKVIKLSPGYLEARSNLGAALVQLERPKEAIVELNAVLQANRGYPDAHANLGAALLLLEQYDQAEAAYRKCLALQPGNVAALVGLASTLKRQNHLSEARRLVDQVLTIEPDKSEAYSLLGEIYLANERYTEAETAFHKAMELDSGLISAHLGLGQIKMEIGQIDEACASFEHAIDMFPNDIMPYTSLARARQLSRDAPSLARMEAEMGKIDELTPTKAVSLYFALGKTYDGLKEYDKAFPLLVEGNRLKRALVKYSGDQFDEVCNNIMTFFSRDNVDQLRGAGAYSDVPIFILGMPRSGTTLVETIIAAHPKVHGAGELQELSNVARQPHPDAAPLDYPRSLKSITQDDLTSMGTRYVDALCARAASARHITDKMPSNYLMLGLIHLILPNAKIVHIKRNALDTCLSVFMQLFNSKTQPHSYDLSEIGRYYVNYARLMEHWREVLPDSAFYELRYEDLVYDKESETRRLIDYCDLKWNDACLESHKSSRSIKTASVAQVRQPVYTSSIGRWRNYEKYLQPLIDALGPYASID